MSIYIFKTEEFYGGKTCVFTNKAAADEYLAEFLKLTENKIDAMIEEHKPTHKSNIDNKLTWRICTSLVREDGWDKPIENVKWTSINPTY
jgi:hypothetical protein